MKVVVKVPVVVILHRHQKPLVEKGVYLVYVS